MDLDKRDGCLPETCVTVLATRLTNTATMKNNIDHENSVLFLPRKVRSGARCPSKTKPRIACGIYRKAEGACANVALLAEQMSLDTAIVAGR